VTHPLCDISPQANLTLAYKTILMYFLHKNMPMQSQDAVFRAIAHPARRQILTLLSDATLSVKELTSEFEMSQPAVSQHLKELRRARLVASERVGLEQRYRLTAGPLKKVFDWSSQYRRFFDPSGHAWAFVSSQAPAGKAAGKAGPGHGR
jgi:DNA-binding transcriptional ArsR family regulator